MNLPNGSMVLVADGAKLMFFRNEGDADALNLKVVDAVEQPHAADRDIKSDFAGQKPGGNAAGEADYQRQAEDRFAAEAAAVINRAALNGGFERLVVVAPPKTLGELRRHYHKQVEARIVAEIPKDLVGHPVDRIEAALRKHENS